MGPTKFTKEDIGGNSVVPSGTPVDTGFRHEFDMKGIKHLTGDRGISVFWEKSYICPCRNPMTHAPQADCPICGGRGIAYLPSEQETIAITSQAKGPNGTDLAMYDSGTAIGTTQSNKEISFNDRITVPEVYLSNQIIFDVTSKRIRQGFRIPYDVKEITYIRNVDKVLVENEDYTLDIDKNIIYPREHLLGENNIVSMNMKTALRYVVIDLLKESRYQYTNKDSEIEQFDNLPKKLLLKREDIFTDQVYFTDENDEEVAHEQDPKPINKPQRENSNGFFGGMI